MGGTTGQSITLANSIIGVGILAMPFCFQQCGVILATLILLIMGLISRLCCYFLLKSALISRRRNFEFLAFHVFGPAGKLAVEVGIIGFLMGTCIAYFVVVGDLGPQIIAKMFNINQSDILRTSIMVIVSLVCVLPLGLLRNVDSLSNVSAATIGFYFFLVMKVISEAASQLWLDEWHRRVEMWRPAGLLQCVPIFSMALFCQTQLFEIFESLPSLSLEKMNLVTKNAINICTGVYFTLGLFGYIAFNQQNISGNILMSLSPTMTSDVIKLGFVMSLAFSFPLIIFPCRASLYSFLYKKVHSAHHDHMINHSIPETRFRCITVAIIAVALFISLLIPNIELVLGLVGSTIGVLICVVFPAACFVNVTFKNTNERILAKGIVILGLVIMVLGTFANLQAAENQAVKYDDKFTQERIDKIVEDFFEKRSEIDSDVKPKSIEKKLARKLDKLADKDSEIQPPNPIPPEVSMEKKEPVKPKEQKKNDVKLQPVQPKVEKTIDHPKNLQTKLNGIKINEEKTVEDSKFQDPPKQSKQKDPVAEEKNDIVKQQKLIETIKQHGKEQKELMKEQKEILDEILKTKQELQNNEKEQKEVANDEAKKIAVESIQKIANVAIKTLSGVTLKPDAPADKMIAEPLEKLANEAVQNIALKAVESIVALNEINDKPKQPEQKGDNNIGKVANEHPALLQNIVQNQNAPQNAQSSGLNTNLDVNPVQNAVPVPNPVNPEPVALNINQPMKSIVNEPANEVNQINAINNNINPVNAPNQQVNPAQIVVNQPVNAADQINAANLPNVQQVANNNLNQINAINNNNNPVNAPNQPVSPDQIVANQPVNGADQVNVANQPNLQPVANNDANQPHQQLLNNQPNINQLPAQVLNLKPVENAPVANKQPAINNQPDNAGNQFGKANISPVKLILDENLEALPVPVNNIHNQQQSNQNQPGSDNNNNLNQNAAAHHHFPDEPQSYKVGEDLHKVDSAINKKIDQNIPLVIAMSDKSQAQNVNDKAINNESHNRNKRDTEQDSVLDNDKSLQKSDKKLNSHHEDAINAIINNVNEYKQKQIIKCSRDVLLEESEAKICKQLKADAKEREKGVGGNAEKKLLIDTSDILPSINLNDQLNPAVNSIFHIRSLKSIDEQGNR